MIDICPSNLVYHAARYFQTFKQWPTCLIYSLFLTLHIYNILRGVKFSNGIFQLVRLKSSLYMHSVINTESGHVSKLVYWHWYGLYITTQS